MGGRGVARTAVMCWHLTETLGFNEAHSEWGSCRRRSPAPSGRGPGGHPEKFLKNKELFKLFSKSNSH